MAQHDGIILFEHEEKCYEKVRCLGTGSFAQVFLCRKHEPDTCSYVALKTINIGSLRESQLDSAMNEIKILSIINNQNIVQYYGSFFWKNKFYIEMEYADAGTLADFLLKLKNPLVEFEILAIFNQVVAAVVYLHRNHVIHRDIKTKNIFLNKQGFIKLGDFGISKILDSNTCDARSFVGTPLYTSPEIFEGKKYNKPCDIWSLGCVLYEMATLKKPFDEQAFPILRRKIIQGKYRPLNETHSKMFCRLVQIMLQKQPSRRPTAWQVSQKVTFMLANMSTSNLSLLPIATGPFALNPPEMLDDDEYGPPPPRSGQSCHHHSQLYRLDLHRPEIPLIPITFPWRIHLKQVVKGGSHYVALTHDHQVFTWGNGSHGELGHGPELLQSIEPVAIELLNSHQVIKIAAGNGFTIFLDNNGLVLSCGQAPCIGDTDHRWQPKIINHLLDINVVDIDCGSDHVVAISATGSAYGWGRNHHGMLGLGTGIAVVTKPIQIDIDHHQEIRLTRVVCGPNATALVDDTGNQIWMCGDNRYNRLALDLGFRARWPPCLRDYTFKPVPVAWRPHRIQLGNRRIQQISLGQNHSMFVFDDRSIVATGCNKHAQLGLSHNRPVSKPVVPVIKIGQQQSAIKSICSGSCFTLVLTADDSLHFWGTRRIIPGPKNSNHDDDDDDDDHFDSEHEFIIGNCGKSLMNIVQNHGPDYPILKISQPQTIIKKIKHLQMISDTRDSIILFPQCILKLYSTRTFCQEKKIHLADLFCFSDQNNQDEIFIMIDSITFDHHQDEKNNKEKIKSSSLEILERFLPSTNPEIMKSSETTTKHSYAWIDEAQQRQA